MTYLCNRQAGTYCLQIESDIPFSGDTQELVLHLENLSIQDEIIWGPYDFTFTVEKRDVELVCFGEADIESVKGTPLRVTRVSISPFHAKVSFIGLETMEMDDNGNPVWGSGFKLSLEALRINGEEVTGFSSQWNGRRSAGPDGSQDGSISPGRFDRVIDPTTVEAIKLNGIWIELSDFTLLEKSDK